METLQLSEVQPSKGSVK